MSTVTVLSSGKRVQWTLILVVSTVGMTAALTVIFLAMRAVMGVGGSCGSGGPYVIAQECPDGVGGLMALSFPGLFLFGGLMAVAAAKLKAPQIVGLAWPALFISLGWNFLDFADQGEAGTDSGFVVCGVLFLVMGAGPLLFGGVVLRASRRRAQEKETAANTLRDTVGRLTSSRDPFVHLGRTTVFDSSGATPPSGGIHSLVADLQNLAALRASGALTDSEFEAAKNAALRQAGAR